MDEPAIVADVMEIFDLSEQFPAPSTFGVFRGSGTRHSDEQNAKTVCLCDVILTTMTFVV